MTKLSNAPVAADAPWGTIIGTFDADLKQLQVTITFAEVISTTPLPTPSPPTSHVVVIGMSEDAYQGDAEYSVAVDEVQAAAGKITTLQSSGKSQDVSVTVPDGTHAITVTLMNDAWGGTPETDLNLHVNYIKYDADVVWSVPTTLWTIGDKLSVTVPSPPVQPTVITLTPVALSIQDNAPAGTVIAIASVVMSDGSQFTGTLTSSDPFFAISGMKIVTARALTAADGGKHTTTITATQGSQIISARLSA